MLISTEYYCLKDLIQLAQGGYPWSPPGKQKIYRNVQNVTDNLRDALDSLNHMCHIQDRSQKCLLEHGIRGFCVSMISGSMLPAVDFQFICHHRQRDENLVRSLQCLQENRLLVMVYFHMASRCRGFGILDDIMRRMKSAYFYILNVYPFYNPFLYSLALSCLPKRAITTCVRPLIDDYCRVMAADFVQHYIMYLHDWIGQAFLSAGLSYDICEHDIGSNYTLDIPRLPPLHDNFGFLRWLEMTAPGTALGTVYGQLVLMPTLKKFSGEELCTPWPVYFAYSACVMSSDVESEMTKFNIVQFAHRIVPVPYHGSHCNRLEMFTTCWNLLQEICGPNVRGWNDTLLS